MAKKKTTKKKVTRKKAVKKKTVKKSVSKKTTKKSAKKKVLTKKIAEQFLLGEGTINQYQTIDSPETAKLLATAKCDLEFEGLTRLDLDIATELIQHTGGDLWLDGLLELPLDLAQVLSKHVGRITFDSVADLDVETATAIAQKKGALGFSGICNLTHQIARALCEGQIEQLELAGLTELSDAAAKSLSKHKGNLGLNRLTTLSDAAAKSLSKYEGNLVLKGLTELTDVAAKSLSRHEGFLNLDGLTSLADAAAESLSKHENFQLNGLTSLSDAAAESLSKHEGELRLRGLTELSDAAAESLSKHAGGLLLGLTAIPDAAAESLSKYEGDLFLDRLTELSDAAAESLSKHEGDLVLNGLTKLSDAGAESLGKHDGQIELDGLTESAAEIFQRYSSTLTLAKARRFSSDEYAVTLKHFTFIDDEAAIFLSGQPSRTLDLTGLKSISLKSVNNLVINHELIVNTEHLSAEIIKALDEGNRSRLDKKQKGDATADNWFSFRSGSWTLGWISHPVFQLICGCCREETIANLEYNETGRPYLDAIFHAKKLGWSVNSSNSERDGWDGWIEEGYDEVIRCPHCTITDPCPNCGKTGLIAIAGEESPICMECEMERLAETLGIIQQDTPWYLHPRNLNQTPSTKFTRDKMGDVLTEELANEFLAGNLLFLSNFKDINFAAAQLLGHCDKKKLILNDLTVLDDASAAALSEYPGDLRLLGLKDISDTAAQHLAKHSKLTITLDNLPASAAKILRDAGHGE